MKVSRRPNTFFLFLAAVMTASPAISLAQAEHVHTADEADHAPAPVTSKRVKVRFEDLPKLVSEKNNRVKAAHLSTEAQKNREGYLGRSFLPKLEAGGAIETFKQGSRPSLTQPTYGAELSISLYNGSRDSLEDDRRKAVTAERRSTALITQADELQKARASFWRMIHTTKKITLLKDAISTNETNQKAAEKRIKSGVATDSDRLEFEMRSVNLARDLASAELEFKQHRRDLAIFVGENIDAVIEPEATLDHQHSWQSELRHTESEHEFQIQSLIQRRNEADIVSKIHARRPLPNVEAFAGYHKFNERGSDRTLEDERSESVVGLRLKMQLGDFWEGRKESQAARVEASALQNQIDHERIEIESHIVTEMDDLSFLHSQVHAAEENVKRSLRYYKLTQNEYARGVKNSPDVVGASDRLLENQLMELNILRDFQISRSHVLSKLGR